MYQIITSKMKNVDTEDWVVEIIVKHSIMIFGC